MPPPPPAKDDASPLGAGLPPKGGYEPYTESPLPPEESYPADHALSAPPEVEALTPAQPFFPAADAFAPAQSLAVPPLPVPPLAAGVPDFFRSSLFTSGFLTGQIGRTVRVESQTGGALTERAGRLRQVGADYLLLQNAEGHDVMCDLKAVRFITIVPGFAQ